MMDWWKILQGALVIVVLAFTFGAAWGAFWVGARLVQSLVRP